MSTNGVFFIANRDTQYCKGKYVIETGNWDDMSSVIELCIAITVLLSVSNNFAVFQVYFVPF